MQNKIKEAVSWFAAYDKRILRILNDEFLKDVADETGNLYKDLSFLKSLKPEHRSLLLALELDRLDKEANPNNDYRNKLLKRANELWATNCKRQVDIA